MPGIDVDDRRSDRGKHLVDLLADGLGREELAGSASEDADMRAIYLLGGVSFALLFTAVTALLVG